MRDGNRLSRRPWSAPGLLPLSIVVPKSCLAWEFHSHARTWRHVSRWAWWSDRLCRSSRILPEGSDRWMRGGTVPSRQGVPQWRRLPKDDGQANLWLQKTAEQGNMDAKILLAILDIRKQSEQTEQQVKKVVGRSQLMRALTSFERY